MSAQALRPRRRTTGSVCAFFRCDVHCNGGAMKNSIRLAAVIGLFVFASHTSDSVLSGTTVRATERTVNIASEYGKLPLSFEPNRGQFDSRYTFGSQDP